MARRTGQRARASWIVASALAVTACGGARAPAAPLGSLRFAGTPRDATVTIDDRYAGPLDVLGARGVALPEGTHRVTVQAEGFFPEDRVVVIRRGAPARVEVTLVPVPP